MWIDRARFYLLVNKTIHEGGMKETALDKILDDRLTGQNEFSQYVDSHTDPHDWM